MARARCFPPSSAPLVFSPSQAIHWQNYESGLFNGCNQTNPDIDHNVVVVGYGEESDGSGYWLVRNSWTPHWGDHGYIKLLRTADEGTRCGEDITPLDGSGCSGGPSKVGEGERHDGGFFISRLRLCLAPHLTLPFLPLCLCPPRCRSRSAAPAA